MKAELQSRTRKLVTLVAGKGGSQVVIAGIFHVLDSDNTGEFDPYFVDRMKNALQMMCDKQFVGVLETEIAENGCFKGETNQNKSLLMEGERVSVQATVFGDKKVPPKEVIEFMSKPLQAAALGIKKQEYNST